MKFINADCQEALGELSNESIDLVVTSPPYDNIRAYKGMSWNFEKFCAIANELKRVLKNGGIIVWNISDQTKNHNESGTSFKHALYFKEIGLNLYDTMIWEKIRGYVRDSNRYTDSFEYMFIFSKGRPKTTNMIKDRLNKSYGSKVDTTNRKIFIKNDGHDPSSNTGKAVGRKIKLFGKRTNVWKMAGSCGNKTGHPATFPAKFAEDHIKSWSNKGDIVLDPFMGSGTTGVACRKLYRDFIGIEISKEYFNKAKRRVIYSKK